MWCSVLLLLVLLQEILAQEQECYSSGSVAGAVVGTLLVTLLLVGLACLVWRIYWRSRRGKHLVLVTDPEGAGDQYAFDNLCFRDDTPIGRTTIEKETNKLDQKARWSPWGALVGPRSTDKRRALDDSFIGEPQVKVNVVALRSHDFTGLGFNICGNMRDGIFVKDVLHRGPASESGCISPGDRIDSIRISFRHMVFEDALTILSYASPYDVQLEVENSSNSRPSTLIRDKRASGTSITPADRICHPFYRSHSIADLAQIGKASLKRMQQMGGISKSPQHDESGDYPTLKLATPPKENVKLEKTAAPASIVKPERAKKSPVKASPSPGLDKRESPTNEEANIIRFQKFGVRVLPDPAAGHRTSQLSQASEDTKPSSGNEPAPKRSTIEPEHRQNEHNSIIEKVSEVPNISEVDGGRSDNSSFHYDERGIDVGPVVPPPRSSPKPAKELAAEETHPKSLLSKGLHNLKEKLHQQDKKPEHENLEVVDITVRQAEEEPDTNPCEGQIPTEIPEEVRRAAMAARSNRKSSAEHLTAERSSSSESEENQGDSLGRAPKRPNKRKAPPPPPEEGSAGQSSQVESDRESEGGKQRLKEPEEINVQTSGKSITTLGDTEITSIAVEDNSRSEPTVVTADDASAKPQHMDYDIGVNVNSDSDSDLERLEGDDDSYDGKVKVRKAKKGGTTIELNSSHITIHHSPSSETVQLENESTRKAASLGDLSRLDTEQPMSILERAVSLDLADGGTPHGSKKRKAPLPPPGEDYLGTPDDEGLAHRKEPRLDSAMDTFQRRRLKKSSDWGTLEEALMQSETPPSEPPPLSAITRTDILNIDDAYSSILGIGPSSEPNSLDQVDQQKTVLRITPEPVAEPSYSSSQITIASTNIPHPFTPNSQHPVGMVSSTPISHSESVQSPIVTSSHAGISSVQVVSSTTPEPDSTILTDAFITAVDSTTSTLAEELSKGDEESNDDTWGQDSQPPELPTSPVPVLSSFKPSPSMTYITEIQVVTSADSSTEPPPPDVTQRTLTYNVDSSPPPLPDSASSEAEVKEVEAPVPQKGNVSVTAIRSTASRIPTRITTDRSHVNHVTNAEEKKAKPARPPVPPRKSDSSKFISFSSLTPTSTENGASRNSTSFEQWVFLDESNTPNGVEGTSPPEEISTVVSLPSRTQSITHIVLDSKQSNGSHSKP